MKLDVTRRSPITGKINNRTFEVEQAEVAAYEAGALIQNAFPRLSPADREFIMTGTTEEDWAAMFPPAFEVDPSLISWTGVVGVVEASSLQLKPGVFPDAVSITSEKTGVKAELDLVDQVIREGEVEVFIYSGSVSGREVQLHILND